MPKLDASLLLCQIHNDRVSIPIKKPTSIQCRWGELTHNFSIILLLLGMRHGAFSIRHLTSILESPHNLILYAADDSVIYLGIIKANNMHF